MRAAAKREPDPHSISGNQTMGHVRRCEDFGSHGRMVKVPKAFPKEFRRDVVAVARRGNAPISRIAKDFGISESCLQRWLKLAAIEDGVRPGTTQAETVELREAKKRIRLLEQENVILRRAAAYLSQASLPK